MGFLYGDSDNFEPRGGVYVAERVKQPVYVRILPNAGHHFY
jgi:hypothetical protein